MKINERPEYKNKPKPVTMSKETLVREAISVMSENNFGSVIVVNKNGTIAGILTERDLMIRLLHKKKNPDKTKLSEIMTAHVRVANEDDNVIDWLRIMSNERFRHLPVVDADGQVVNMMSQGDFLSYTWPELLDQVKEKTKESFNAGYQIFFIVLALLSYAALVKIFA